MLLRVKRALVPGGLLFLTVPQYPSLWSPQDTLSGHKRRYTRAELEEKIRVGAFEIVYCGSLFCAIFPLYLLSRWQKQRLTSQEAEKQALSEFQLSRRWNALLTWLCQFDLWAIRLGWRLPFGSSLALVARSI